MKLLFFLTTFLFSFLINAQTQLRVSADIRGRSCSGGLGLCSGSTIVENKNATVIAQKLSQKTLILSFDPTSLSKVNQESIAGKEFSKILINEKIDFVQEVDVALDPKTVLSLGFDPKWGVIKKGVYPMIIDSDKVIVTFTLSEK